jgi:hypothetical protein
MRGSFTCRKVGAWNRLFNFPSEGRHAEDFHIQKNPTASAGFEPANSGTRTTWPPKPSSVGSYWTSVKHKLRWIIQYKFYVFNLRIFLSVFYWCSVTPWRWSRWIETCRSYDKLYATNIILALVHLLILLCEYFYLAIYHVRINIHH